MDKYRKVEGHYMESFGIHVYTPAEGERGPFPTKAMYLNDEYLKEVYGKAPEELLLEVTTQADLDEEAYLRSWDEEEDQDSVTYIYTATHTGA